MKAPRFLRSLKFKVGFHLAVALLMAVMVFGFFIARHHRIELLKVAVDHVRQLSEVITKSTRFAMLQNQRHHVYQTIRNVGLQEGITKVRIWSKEGIIVLSTDHAEITQSQAFKSTGCRLCHEEGNPSPSSAAVKSWIYDAGDGGRILGVMEAIRNDPSCYQASVCHAHSERDRVLGILEIGYSLDDIDAKLREDSMTIAGFSIGLVIVCSLFVSFFIHRMVYTPLRDLESGSRRLSSGNLDQLIPVRSRDEFGHLASSFNAMTLALRNTELELQEWNRTLEEKVREKTEELQIAEAKTAQAEKMASVGLLAAGVAHELNNPLTGVLTFTNLLRKKVPDASPEAEDLDLVIRETKRCSSIIRRLLDFAREKKPEKRFVDINTLIIETAEIVKHPAATRHIEVELDLDQGLPQVWIDPNQLKQVFMNLFVNAQDAIGSEGKMTVRSAMLPGGRSPAESQEPVPTLVISVSDTGGGIPEENLQKIFDPFFTTKGVGRGTGLGLSVTYGIIQSHGGTIEVDSRPGEGTTFRIYVPLSGSAAEVPEEEHERQNTRR